MFRIALTLLLATLFSIPAVGQSPVFQWESILTAPDSQPGDQFGRAVSIGENRAVITAWRREGTTGGAHVYRWNGLKLDFEATLIPHDAVPGSMCGIAAHMNTTGEIVVISALGDNSAGINAGAVYVFRRLATGWIEEAKLIAPDAQDSDFFGSAVAAGTDTIVVGARGVDTPPFYYNSGAVYVFRYQDGKWESVEKFVAPDIDIGDGFGTCLDIDDERFAVGVPQKDTEFGDNSGAVYIYAKIADEWVFEDRIVGQDQVTGNAFGLSVALDEDRLLAGSTSSQGAQMSGSVYLFNRSQGVWTQTDRLTAPVAADFDFFGETVSFDGQTALISGRFGGPSASSVHIFEINSLGGIWNQTLSFPNSSPHLFANNTVALGSHFALVGEALHGNNLDDDASEVDLFRRQHALRSVIPVSYTVDGANVTGGEFSNVFLSDNQDFRLTSIRGQFIRFNIESNVPSDAPRDFAFRLEAALVALPFGDVAQIVEMLNHDTGNWEVVDVRPAETSDQPLEITPTGDWGRFIQHGTRLVKARIEWRRVPRLTPAFSPAAWSVDIDESVWLVTQ